jgi:hypothetical protein
MKKMTMATFTSREDAEKAINDLHRKLKIDPEDISYIYRNRDSEQMEVNASEISSDTPTEGAKKGATIGGVLGAIGGIAAFAGAIPIVGPIFAAGPLLAALGLTGAAGGAAAGAVTGGAAGGLIGALANWGVDKPRTTQYNDSVMAGNILLAVHAEEDVRIAEILSSHNARDIDTYEPTI